MVKSYQKYTKTSGDLDEHEKCIGIVEILGRIHFKNWRK